MDWIVLAQVKEEKRRIDQKRLSSCGLNSLRTLLVHVAARSFLSKNWGSLYTPLLESSSLPRGFLVSRFRTLTEPLLISPPPRNTPTTVTMASYMTGSEAYSRENHVPTGSGATPQSAWADKYRGVSLSPIDRNPRLAIDVRRQRWKTSTHPQPYQSRQMIRSPPL